MNLVLFDLDNTLLGGDSDHAWSQFLIEEGVLDRDIYEQQNEKFYADYKSGKLDINAFLAFQSAPLVGRSAAELQAWHNRYMQKKIKSMILEKGKALIDSHRGAEMAIVTATNRFVTEPIAKVFGIDNLIACELERDANGNYTGRGTGVPSYREGKIARVDSWLAGQGKRLDDYAHSYFYSDSLNDLPLLNHVTNPVAVDPDATLHAHATKMNWPIISLR